jgi:AMMECR1 domain-containing protein
MYVENKLFNMICKVIILQLIQQWQQPQKQLMSLKVPFHIVVVEFQKVLVVIFGRLMTVQRLRMSKTLAHQCKAPIINWMKI